MDRGVRRLERGLPGRAALVGLGIFLAAMLGLSARASYGARTAADEPQYLLTALSIAEDRDLDIANQRSSGAYRGFHEALLPVQTILRPDGSRISPHSPLLPLYLAAPMGLWGWAGAKAALAALAGALGGLLVWVGAGRLGVSFGAAALVAMVLGLSPPLAVYATQVYPEIAAALAVTAALAALTGRLRIGGAAALAAAVIALPWLAVKYIPAALALAAAGGWKLRNRPKHLGGLLAVLLGAGAAYLWFNQAVYGGWTPYASGDFFTGGEFTAVGPSPDLWGRSSRLLGLWVDRAFGLAAWQPAYLLAIPAIAWAVRRRLPRCGLLLGVGAVGWLVAAFLAQTMHGWWWPGRQVVAVIPALALLLMAWVDRIGRRKTLFLGLGAAGAAAFLALALEASTGRLALIVDFTSTANPLYRGWSALLPDYMAATPLTWALHGLWTVAFAVLAALGWRSGGREPGEDSPDPQKKPLLDNRFAYLK